MESMLLFSALLLLFNIAAFGAQNPPSDQLDAIMFPPGWVMENQQELGLTEEQKTLLRTEMRQAVGRFTELQWQLQDEMEKLVELVKQDRVDESQTLAQLDKVLNLEREVKRAHIALFVKIKNTLSPEQLAKLREIRGKSHNSKKPKQFE